ncbi:hypothetical protein [Gehongia tenuis]|uniref:Uncharacterized protein n=1 Tax=Gehongia tenuis TaxID=2763655 RepID=A0A926HQB1_9FIRM|nr:hypothetical protein [Gehongia tenuis]MBC8531066.1 hypothetical protein [Gehongia tenuis]
MGERRKDRRGESMIIALIIMFILLLMGVTVLTAASATMGTAAKRTEDRQLYYYARSVLDTLDETLQHGELGRALRNSVVRELLASGGEEITFSHETAPAVAAERCSVEDVVLRYQGTASVMERDESGAPTQYFIGMDSVKLSFTVAYRDQRYSMNVSYHLRSAAFLEDGEWRWDDLWTVESLGQ